MRKEHPAVGSMGMSKGKKALKPESYSIDYGVFTHIGRRQHNQDSVRIPSAPVSLNSRGQIFAIADGMGGNDGGGLASRLACDGLNYFEKEIKKQVKQRSVEIRRHLAEVIIRIDRHIRLHGIRDSKLEDMGTTLSCLVITDTHSIIAHVGDSRIYRLRKGHLTCLTVDHTFVQDMILEGEVDPSSAHLHPLRHMLTRVVGTGEPLELVDSRIDLLKKDDRFLLCSDGLYNALTDAKIIDLLSSRPIASESASKLVTQALQTGAHDNITAIVIKMQKVDNLYPTYEK
jgi:serine/threonine protein phosphatase PrpC